MRLLLDTHAALWAITDDARLPETIRALIENPSNDVLVSAVSVWEISIKHALGRGGAHAMPITGREALKYFDAAGYGWLGVTPGHAAAVEDLPPIHADPFDRLLVAQALQEPMRLVTHDAILARYSDTTIHF